MKKIILSLSLLISAHSLLAMQAFITTDAEKKRPLALTYSASGMWFEIYPSVPQKTAVVLTQGNIYEKNVTNIVIGLNELGESQYPGMRVKAEPGTVFEPEEKYIRIKDPLTGQETKRTFKIIRVVEPSNEDEQALKECYVKSFMASKGSIAFPSLSTKFDFDPNKAAPVAIKAVSELLEKNPKRFQTIKFIVTEQEWGIYKRLLDNKFGHSEYLEKYQ